MEAFLKHWSGRLVVFCWFFFSLKEKFCGICFSYRAGVNLCETPNHGNSILVPVLINHYMHGYKKVFQCLKLLQGAAFFQVVG